MQWDSHTVVITQWLSHSVYHTVVTQLLLQSVSQADLSFIAQPMGLKDFSVLLMLNIQVHLDSYSSSAQCAPRNYSLCFYPTCIQLEYIHTML